MLLLFDRSIEDQVQPRCSTSFDRDVAGIAAIETARRYRIAADAREPDRFLDQRNANSQRDHRQAAGDHGPVEGGWPIIMAPSKVATSPRNSWILPSSFFPADRRLGGRQHLPRDGEAKAARI